MWCDKEGCRTGERWKKLSLMWDGVVARGDKAEGPEEVVKDVTVAQIAVAKIRREVVSWRMALETDGVLPEWLRDRGRPADPVDAFIKA